MKQQNLTLSEAAKLQLGDRVIYNPAASGKPFPNPLVFKDLKIEGTYTVIDIELYGSRRYSEVVQKLSADDLEGRTITDKYHNPLTNVPIQLDGISGQHWYGYFRKN